MNSHHPALTIVLKCLGCKSDNYANLAQLGERMTEDHKVPGSIPGVGIPFAINE